MMKNELEQIVFTEQKDAPAWACVREFDLGWRNFRKISLTLETQSSFMRFGIKLLDGMAAILGEKHVLNKDSAVFFHIGKQSDSPKVAFVVFVNGDKVYDDKVLEGVDGTQDIRLAVEIEGNKAVFFVNDVPVYKQKMMISPMRRVGLLAWGDGEKRMNEYRLAAKNVVMETE